MPTTYTQSSPPVQKLKCAPAKARLAFLMVLIYFGGIDMRSFALICCGLLLVAQVATPAQEARIEMADLSGIVRHPLETGEKAGSVLIFYWHDCPICNSYAPEINRLSSDFTNFSFYTVDVDPDWTAAEARIHVQQFGLRAPFLLDSGHRLVALAHATVTPEAVVFGKNHEVLYRGRIDNVYAALNQRRPSATERDLRLALEAISEGRAVTNQPPPIGCIISDVRMRK
jgi:hypothetical protein